MANNTDWLNISQMTGGTGETALSLTALTNTSLEPKTATITARNTQYNVSDTTTVTIQGFVPTLTLSRSTLRFDSTGGTATFTVYSNTAWTINFPALVHSYSTSAGTGDTEVTVVLAPNPDEVAKIDTGIVKDVYNVNQLFLTIVQESFITELYVEPDDDIVFANTGSSTSVTITSNTDWELEYPSWVVPSVTTGASGATTVTFTAGENGPTDRSGQIIVYAGSKSVTINAFQPFYIPPYITVTPSAWTFNYTEDGKVFVVDSYPAWSGEVVSTGETVWTSDVYMEATFNIPSAMTMPLYSGGSGDTVATYLGPVRFYGSEIYFPAAGTYKVRYEIGQSGSTPSLQGNTYLTDLYFTDGVGQLGSLAFSGCSSLTGIVSDCVAAPSLQLSEYSDGNYAFAGVHPNGTIVYPANSDYSSWLSFRNFCLGLSNWNNIAIDSAFVLAKVFYNVTSTTDPTLICYNTNAFAFRTDDGVITRTGYVNETYTFNSVGTHYAEFLYLPVSDTSKTLNLKSNIYPSYADGGSVTEVIVPDYSQNVTFSLYGDACPNLTAITVNHNCEIARALFNNVLVYRVGGSTTTVPAAEGPFLEDVIVTTTGNTVFPENCFVNCASLTSVTVTCPGNVEFGQYCFCGATSLATVSLPAGQTSFGYMCFVEAKGLTGFTSMDSVTGVGDYCFRYCESLENFTWPSGVTQVPYGCFQFCTGLTSVTLPSEVTSLDTYCFYECSNLRSITSLATTAPSSDRYIFRYISGNGVLYYPAGSDYSSWLNWLGSGWTGVEI